jgi:adenylate cyclase
MATAAERPRLTVRLGVALLVSILFLAIYQRADDSPLLRPLELQTLDLRFRLRGVLEPGPETALVMIDDGAVDRYGRWPLPREVLADAIDRLAADGARVIALDLLLTEASPGLDPALRRLLEQSRAALGTAEEPLRALIDRRLAADDPDLDLAVAIARADRVVTPYAFVYEGHEGNIHGTPPWITATAYPVYLVEPGALPDPPSGGTGLLVATSQLASVGISTGHVSLLLDLDGTLRFELPVVDHAGRYYPSLPVEAARLYLGVPRDQMLVRFNRGVEIGGVEVPTDGRMRHLVNYYGPAGTIETHTLADLLDGTLPKGLFSDRIVVLGANVTGAGDQFPTPFAQRLPGAEHLATVIDNILTRRSLIRDFRTRLVDMAAIVLLAIAAALLGGRRSRFWSTASFVLLPAGWLAIAVAAFILADWWLSALVPTVAALAGAGIVESLNAVEQQRRRRALERRQGNLARYFPPPVVERLAGADRPIELDRTQMAAVMFIDIVGFTRLTETLPPATALALLREFHGRVESAVFAHGGMVDKFIGDGALACFGVPDESAHAAADALAAARALLLDLAAWREQRLADGEAPIHGAIGIHHGAVLMGDIGGRRQFQFTVIGDPVNTASRLEALTRSHATPLIVSQALLDAIGPDAPLELIRDLERMPPMRVRGREEVMQLWRLEVG